MRVRVNNSYSFFYEVGDKERVQELLKDYFNTLIIVGVDQSKSNTGIVVKNLKGDVLLLLELSGNDKEFFQIPLDTSAFCLRVKDLMFNVFKFCNVVAYGFEATIIAKHKGDGGKAVISFEVVKTLQEIRATFSELRETLFTGAMFREPNRYTWGSETLPKEYNSRKHKKGSKVYLNLINPNTETWSDDLTDAYFIADYLIKEYNFEHRYCDAKEEPLRTYKAYLVNMFLLEEYKYEKIYWAPYYTVTDILNYYVNRRSEPGVLELPQGLENLTEEEVYDFSFNSNVDYTQPMGVLVI